MRKPQLQSTVIGLFGLLAVVVAACGGQASTPTPAPASPTTIATQRPPTPAIPAIATVAPTATPTTVVVSSAPTATIGAAGTPTPTAAARTPTPVPLATATPAPSTPTAVAGKYGGVLQTRFQQSNPILDTYDVRGQTGFHYLSPFLNSLIFVNPYGDGKTLSGDAAERWDLSAQGNAVTFFLRKGIKWHDGAAFTSKDAAYNFERGRKPRTPTMTTFQAGFQIIESIETPDDSTVRVNLKQSSNAFLENVALSAFLMYPSQLPFPEKYDEWKAKPIGTGPFKVKSYSEGNKVEYVRNEAYWKPSLPYLDGNNVIHMLNDICLAAFRAGKIDVTMFDPACTDDIWKELQRNYGFQFAPIFTGLNGASFNQRAPWTDARVREAVDLALNRFDIATSILKDRMNEWSAYPSPLLPPEYGGRWGIPAAQMKTRPGYRDDKTQDMARAKALLAQAGIDPAKVNVEVTGVAGPNFSQAEVAEGNLRALGFKVTLSPLPSAPSEDKKRKGDFDMEIPQIGSVSFDDPMDHLASWYVTGGVRNYGKWSDPEIDRLFFDQDKIVDPAKRKQTVLDLQEKVLSTRWVVPVDWRVSYAGQMRWVKNYPMNLPFLFHQRYRHEQVWLER